MRSAHRCSSALHAMLAALAMLGATLGGRGPALADEPAPGDDVPDATSSALEPSDPRLAEARATFREGLALMTAGDFAAARAKFMAVAEVRMTAQVAFNLAECETHLGMFRAALGNYRLAASRAADGLAPKVEAVVDKRITDVEARIAHVTLRRGSGAAGAKVTLDGLELGAKDLDVDLPLDPGSHVIVLERGGRQLAQHTFTLKEGQSKTIDLEVEDAPSVRGPAQPGPVGDDASTSGRTVAGVVLTGTGTVSLGAGVVFLILRQGKISELDEVCTADGSCPPSAETTADDGRLFTGLAEVTIPLGVVGIAAGIILLATGESEDAAAVGPLRLTPGVAGSAGRGAVGGVSASWSF